MYGINLEQKQTHNLTQAYIQSLEILALSNDELHTLLENEYLENPIFEYTEHIANKSNRMIVENYGIEELSTLEEMGEDITTYIKEQLDFNLYSRKELEIIEYLTGNLDENGYCSVNEAEVAKQFETTKKCIEKCLSDLKKLEPEGIFAENLQECLLIQARNSGKCDMYLEQIIKYYLQDIARGTLGNVTKKLEISTNTVRKYAAFIAKLNPRPLQGKGKVRNKYIVPDIILKKEKEKWEVYLNDNWVENYHLNDFYINMIDTTKDEELRVYFKNKLKRAKMLFQSIEQRRNTIIKIMKCIALRQDDFFRGNSVLKSMTMEQIASDVRLHVSSVSRAINGKYLQYQGGTVYLKDLFISGVKQADGQMISIEEIKCILKEFVTTENKTRPYSDSKLVELFKEKGIQVSRRTVAKYREELGIQSSFARKELVDE